MNCLPHIINIVENNKPNTIQIYYPDIQIDISKCLYRLNY